LTLLFVSRVLSFSSGQVVALSSNAFQHVYLRMDGSSCTSTTGPGCGSVNAQYYATPTNGVPNNYEQFKLHQNIDGTWCIMSNYFPNAYLRVDGSSCTLFSGPGCGSVNAQYYAAGSDCGGYESFNLVPVGNSQYGIQSVYFPNAYLRTDGSSCSSMTGPGCGTVDAQYYPSGQTPNNNYESWLIIPIPSPPLYTRSAIYNLGSGKYLAMDSVGNFLSQGSPYPWLVQSVGTNTYTIQIYNPNTNIYPSSPWYLCAEDNSGFRAALTGGPLTYCEWVATPVSGVSDGYTLYNTWLTSSYSYYHNLFYWDDYNFVFTYDGGSNEGNNAVWVFYPM